MPSTKPKALIDMKYEEYAQEYLRSLPPEHFMEATDHATQREITLESLALVRARRREVHVFNELLVQYPLPGKKRPGQVVPDNMVVISAKKPWASTSYNVPVEDARPFWVLEYVSRHNKRKDYDESFDKYEKELRVPYCLMFYPGNQELTLYRHNGRKYVSVRPNEHGRHAVPDLDLEVGLLDGWVRFWYKGKLLPLPAELQRDLDEARQQVAELRKRLEEERQARQAAERQLARSKDQPERRGRRNGNS